MPAIAPVPSNKAPRLWIRVAGGDIVGIDFDSLAEEEDQRHLDRPQLLSHSHLQHLVLGFNAPHTLPPPPSPESVDSHRSRSRSEPTILSPDFSIRLGQRRADGLKPGDQSCLIRRRTALLLDLPAHLVHHRHRREHPRSTPPGLATRASCPARSTYAAFW